MTPKQKRFCEEYLIDLNATQAAIRAGYSERTAYSIAQENLKKPEIQEYIDKLVKEREKRTEITQDRVLKELAKLAFVDPRKFYDSEGKLIPVHDLDDDSAAALAGFEVIITNAENEKGLVVTKKIKIADKKAALDSIARHLGMFINKTEITGKDGSDLVPTSGVLLVPAPLAQGEWEKAAAEIQKNAAQK